MVTTLVNCSVPAAPSNERWPLGTHYVNITSLQECRLFGTANEGARRRKSAVFYQGIEARQRLPQGMHDRCEEYVFAAGNPTKRDLRGLNLHLPLRYKVIRLGSHQVRAGDVWDLTVSVEEHWPELDYLEEVFVFLQVDHLFLEENARIIIRGNVLAVECGTLERLPGKPCLEPVSADFYDFGILPTPFSVDRTTNSNTGADGQSGVAGAHGAAGTSARIEGSLFGPYMRDPADDMPQADPHGRDGGHGGHGTSGSRGRNGGMCRLADIRIGQLIGFENNPLRIFSQAGPGSPGGNGGCGGDGGAGGNGADLAIGVNGMVPAGNGGHGGDGGDGGNGGNGGNGGIASNIFLQLRAPDCPHVQTLSLPSVGGAGGTGGLGGNAGHGGRGGKGDGTLTNEKPGHDGSVGRAGSHGCSGDSGKARPGARIFVIAASDR